MKVGFIGLGNLGRAVAGRLVDRGHHLSTWNRTPGREEGIHAEPASSPAELATRVDTLFLCLFDSASVRSVLTAKDGLLAADLADTTIIDLTTNHFRDVLDFHDQCTQGKGIYLEAPVLGSVVPASQGNLTVLVSGSEAGYNRCRPLFEDIGKNIFYLREPGLATRMKLVNNMVLGSLMATLAEAVALGEKAGMTKEDILEILSVGAGNSLVLSAKKEKLLTGDFAPHFSTDLILKDLHCLQDLAYEYNKAVFSGSLTKELYAKACEQGLGGMDFSSIYQIFKR